MELFAVYLIQFVCSCIIFQDNQTYIYEKGLSSSFNKSTPVLHLVLAVGGPSSYISIEMCPSPVPLEDRLAPCCRWCSTARPTSPHQSAKWTHYKFLFLNHVILRRHLRKNTLRYVADQSFHILLKNSLSLFFDYSSSLLLLLQPNLILMTMWSVQLN